MKVAVGQFGAPTAVFNASLYGVLDQLQQGNAEVLAIRGGALGLSQGDLRAISTNEPLEWLLQTPGAALAAGRQSDFRQFAGDAVGHLQAANIDALVVLGGNGTMALGQQMEEEARARGYGLQVIGVPKTIDNDIVGVDHTPGYPSAAQFILQAVRDLSIDLEAMVGFEQVRVVEVMGRRTGWLAAAASLYSEVCGGAQSVTGEAGQGSGAGIQPLIYIPERAFDVATCLTHIEENVQRDGCSLVVISEGVRPVDGRAIVQSGHESAESGTFMLGGVGAWLAQTVREQTGYGVRYENLGLLQRCWAGASVPLDVTEAVGVGREGARRALAGESGVMIVLARAETTPYEGRITTRRLCEVAGKERMMTAAEAELGPDFQAWLRPLLDWSKLRPYPRLTLSTLSNPAGPIQSVSNPAGPNPAPPTPPAPYPCAPKQAPKPEE